MRIRLAAGCTLLLFAGAAPAEEQKRALIVAVSQYASPQWDTLSSANDVPLLRAALELHGFAPESIHVLLDAAATKRGIEDAIEKYLASSKDGNIVGWGGPEALVSTARDTLVVVRELFENAQKSVLIGGYAFDHGKDIFAPLHTAMAERGVETTIFLNDVEGFVEKNWPFGEPLPSIYCDPRTAERQSRFSLHAKCIVVDEARALVTSANFTDRGQTRNIEMGVLVDDPGLATRLVHQWRGLIESGLVTRA